MPKIKIKNERYSYLTGQMVSKPYELECEIRKENKSTYEIYVPKLDKIMVVKKRQVEQ